MFSLFFLFSMEIFSYLPPIEFYPPWKPRKEVIEHFIKSPISSTYLFNQFLIKTSSVSTIFQLFNQTLPLAQVAIRGIVANPKTSIESNWSEKNWNRNIQTELKPKRFALGLG